MKQHILKWVRLRGDSNDTHIVSHGWHVIFHASGDLSRETVRFDGPRRGFTFRPAHSFQVQDVWVRYPWSVVATIDKSESMHPRRGRIRVYDLRDGSVRRLGSGHQLQAPASVVQLAVGGHWLAYTGGNQTGHGAFCVERISLPTLRGNRPICVHGRHGIDDVRLHGSLLGVDSFDDHHPVSCRTLVYSQPSGTMTTLTAARKCKGWEVVPFADGSVAWSQVPKEQQLEYAKFYIRRPDGMVHSLGWGYTGTLEPCGDYVYFVRREHFAKHDGHPQQLMRWSPRHGLQLVWTPSIPGPEILEPDGLCGGTNITIGAVGGKGARQRELVTARVGK